MADLDIEPLRNLQQAVQDLYILASPQSPMRDLLAGITRQLALTQPPPPPPGVAGATTSRLSGIVGVANGAPPELPGKAIEDRYAALIAFVGKSPGAPIDNALMLLNDLQQQLAKLAAAPAKGTAAVNRDGDDPSALLRAEAGRYPQPVARWLETTVAASDKLVVRQRCKIFIGAACASPPG